MTLTTRGGQLSKGFASNPSSCPYCHPDYPTERNNPSLAAWLGAVQVQAVPIPSKIISITNGRIIHCNLLFGCLVMVLVFCDIIFVNISAILSFFILGLYSQEKTSSYEEILLTIQ